MSKREEKTAALQRNNIIHVNFYGERRQPRHEAQLRQPGELARVAPFERRKSTLALSMPWLLRVAALVGIFVLSLLIL